MDTSDDACGTQLSQEHDGQELPVAFLSHTFTEPNENGAQEPGSLLHLLCSDQVELISTGI